MNDLQLLAGLVLPAQVSWWPLASGWYLLTVLIVLLIALLFYKKRQHYAQNSYLRAALQQMQQLTIAQASQMLVILQHTVNHGVNNQVELQEKAFLSALNQGHKSVSFNASDWSFLNQFAYQQTSKTSCLESEFSELKAKCLQWIKEHDYVPHA